MTNENAKEFWERVKDLIKHSDETQETLSQKCNVSLNVIKAWIHNERLPDAAQAVKIAKTLNTSVEYLVFGVKQSELQSKVINAFGEINSKVQPSALNILEELAKIPE